MTSEMNEILELLNKISISDSPKVLLTDLKISLTGLQPNRIQNVPGINDFNILFDSLNSSDSEQVELCVDILNKLLPLLDARIVVEQIGDRLFRGLEHPNEKARCLSLQQVQFCAQAEGGLHVLLNSKPLIFGTIKCVGDESLGVVKLATSTLTTIASTSAGVAAIFSSEGVATLEQVMIKSDSCRFNVYEVIIKISLLHDEALAVVSNSGLLEKLIAEVTGGDILVQLNALEMLTTLAVNPAGLALLQQAGVVAKFQYLLSLTETDPLTAMLLPGLLKFFGNLGQVQPLHLAEHFPSVLVTIFKLSSGCIEASDPVLELVALETLTFIGSTVEGKYALMKHKSEMEKTLQYFGGKLSSITTDIKTRILEAVVPLFVLQPELQNEELLTVTHEWWCFFTGSSSVEKLVDMIKKPFPDLHQSALIILTTLVALPWGQRLASSEPGFVEYLLDRGTESTKRGKELKWETIKVIINTSFCNSYFSSEYLERMNKYYKQGPFYVETDPQLAFEGDGES